MPRVKRTTVTEYQASPLTLGNLSILSGLVAAFYLFVPTGCSTVEGMGRDLQSSSRMVRDWWNRDKSKPEPMYMDAAIVEDER